MTKFTVPFPSQLDVRWMGLWCGEIFYLSEFLFLITNPTDECTHIDITHQSVNICMRLRKCHKISHRCSLKCKALAIGMIEQLNCPRKTCRR